MQNGVVAEEHRRGHIVNITTSLVDHADSKRPSALASLTKGGLGAVTRSLAAEYASPGVRVNAVALGVIKTPHAQPQILRRHGRPSLAGPLFSPAGARHMGRSVL